MLISRSILISDSVIANPYENRLTDQTPALQGAGSEQQKPAVAREEGRSASAAVDSEKAFFLSRLSVDASADGLLILNVENDGGCSDTKQKHRQASRETPGVKCSSVDGADGHGGNLGIWWAVVACPYC